MPLAFKQSSPLISVGRMASKSMAWDGPVYLLTLIWLLIINNLHCALQILTRQNASTVSANLEQVIFPGKLLWQRKEVVFLLFQQTINKKQITLLFRSADTISPIACFGNFLATLKWGLVGISLEKLPGSKPWFIEIKQEVGPVWVA